MKCFVVDTHQKALKYWAEYRQSLEIPPRLLTLDHHTDTSAPFRKYLKNILGVNHSDTETQRQTLLSKISYRDLDSVVSATRILNNDEHIITAIKTNIISSAIVIAHNARDTDLDVYKEHHIICRSVDHKQSYSKIERLIYDQVIESIFLNKILISANSLLTDNKETHLELSPFILDIDLDYFNTVNSIKPSDISTLKRLVNLAGIITIATEDEYVKNLAQDPELNSEMILKNLTKLLDIKTYPRE